MGDRHIPIIDEDKLDDIITALQSLSAPSGTNVAISPTGMHIVTENNAQGAISELDAGLYATNASLTQLDFVKKAVINVQLSSSSPATITFKNPYFAFVVIGFVQGLGSAVVAGRAETGTVTAKDVLTGSNWSSSHLVFSASSNKLTISSDNANTTSITLIGGNI